MLQNGTRLRQPDPYAIGNLSNLIKDRLNRLPALLWLRMSGLSVMLKGSITLDQRLSVMMPPLPALSQGQLSASQQQLAAEIAQQVRDYPHWYPLPLIQLIGSDSLSQQQIAREVTTNLNMNLHRLSIEQLPANNSEIDMLARLWQRESTLVPLALILDAQSWQANGKKNLADAISHLLSHNNGLIFLASDDIWAQASTHSLTYDVKKPSSAEQKAFWQIEMGELWEQNGEIQQLILFLSQSIQF